MSDFLRDHPYWQGVTSAALVACADAMVVALDADAIGDPHGHLRAQADAFYAEAARRQKLLDDSPTEGAS